MNRDRFLPTFSLVFVLIYAASVAFNWAAFTYFPAESAFYWFVPPLAHARGHIPMFWYGWVVTTTIASVIVAALLGLIPLSGKRGALASAIWAAPIVAIGAILYVLSIWFRMG